MSALIGENRLPYMLVGSGAALMFGLLAWFMTEASAVPGDHAVIAAVQGWEHRALTTVMIALSWIGSTPVMIAICLAILAVMYLKLKLRVELLFFVFSLLGSYGLNKLLKLWLQRERPDIYRLVEADGFSFPSGHAMQAFALYATLVFLLWRHVSSRRNRLLLLIGCVTMIVTIGISRIYLGVHYPSDVIGSYAAGAVWFCLTVCLFRRHLPSSSHS
ncbi:phosphatase PAP2 family protein [Paenibacillus chartarius]|uniref:Phosphatase PAP2 family protein n=1 Tax=Paenibacillus chartarius TaxID=747481 RepID=A0ABV6DM52_9BACL